MYVVCHVVKNALSEVWTWPVSEHSCGSHLQACFLFTLYLTQESTFSITFSRSVTVCSLSEGEPDSREINLMPQLCQVVQHQPFPTHAFVIYLHMPELPFLQGRKVQKLKRKEGGNLYFPFALASVVILELILPLFLPRWTSSLA